MLNVLDEFTRECLAIRAARKFEAADVIDVLSALFILRGVPAHSRSDNGPAFIAESVPSGITSVGAKTADPALTFHSDHPMGGRSRRKTP